VMNHQSISAILSLAVAIFVGYGALCGRLNYQTGGTMLLSVLAYWAEPPKPKANQEGDKDGDK
jgi:hypothetical protein